VGRERYVSSDVERFVLDGSTFIFCERTQELFSLNSVAAYIWCCFEDNLDFADTTGRLSRDLQIEEPRARTYVREVTEEWRQRGLLGASDNNTRHKLPPNCPMLPDVSGRSFQPPTNLRFYSKRCFRILSQTFQIRFTSGALEDKVIQVIGHLEVYDLPRDGLVIDIIEERDGIALAVGSSCVWRCKSLEEIAPAVKSYLFIKNMEQEPHTLAFHAAAVSKSECSFLFPGTSGAGKTTLTARLLRSGFDYISDDIILWDQPSNQICSLSVHG